MKPHYRLRVIFRLCGIADPRPVPLWRLELRGKLENNPRYTYQNGEFCSGHSVYADSRRAFEEAARFRVAP